MTPLTNRSSNRPQPRGTQQPLPDLTPLARLLALLVVAAALIALHQREELLAWAAQQQALTPPRPAAVSPLLPRMPALTPLGLLAKAVTATLSQPAVSWIEQAALAALVLLLVELVLRALVGPLRALAERRAARTFLRVRTLPVTGLGATDADLLRTLHALLPSNPLAAGLGLAPWIALTLHGRPGEPVELGVALAAPNQRSLKQLIAAVRTAIAGHAPGALVEVAPDPLASLPTGATVAWRTFRMMGAHELPLRVPTDSATDLLGPIASSLRPSSASFTELQLALRPQGGSSLTTGWRAGGLRRLLRLQQRAEYALGHDARRLEARLSSPSFVAELRLVVVAEGPATRQSAMAAVSLVRDALGILAERTGPWRQAIIPSGGGRGRLGVGGSGLPRQLALRLPSPSRPARLLLPLPGARPALVLTASEICGLWHLPTEALGGLVRTQACRHIPAPIQSFLPEGGAQPPARDAGLALGTAWRPDGSAAPVGVRLSDLRYVLHLTAGMGAGKSRLLANLCNQLLGSGYFLIDGKGDDAGGLSSFVQRLIPLADERRVVILDPRDARWPVGMNPLAGLDLRQPGAVDRAVANVFALFARIDPETWGGAPGMRDFLDKGLRLVLAAEAQPTLAHVKQCLLDGDYRAGLIERCRNRDVVDYWQTVFPRLSEGQRSSRDALLRRFDKLLSADLLRLMITRPAPELNLEQAIADRAIVVVPIPNVALGDLAGVYAMLVFQQFLRAAFARTGDDQTRVDYPLIVDELQVLIAEAANDDIETALSRLRAFAIPLVLAHQARDQLGPVASLVDINAENRVILKTREPDAGVYARQYGHRGLTAGDIVGQDPAEHQYAVLRCGGQPAGPFSMAPLPWPEVPGESLTQPTASSWQQLLPPECPADGALARLAQLVYDEAPSDVLSLRAEGFAQLPDDHFTAMLQLWEQLRALHLAHIEAHPECIADKLDRLRWRSRLRFGMPYVLAEALYRRARPEVRAADTPEQRRRPAEGAARAAAGGAAAQESPAFTQADRETPQAEHRVSTSVFPESDDER